MQTFRLIIDPPRAGAMNMGIDEALLGSVASPVGQPTLRFYQWDCPTITLGYFQPIEVWEAQPAAVRALDLVRRATGGGAILHDAELTYSLTVPANWPGLAGQATRLYGLAHEAIAAGLNELGVPAVFHAGPAEGNAQRGPFFCFARRHSYDLVVGGDKIVGSAQRRKAGVGGRGSGGGAILQHGSIIIRRAGPQPCTGVNDHRPAGQPVTAAELVEVLVNHFATGLVVELTLGQLSDGERSAAAESEAKYASATWTRQR